MARGPIDHSLTYRRLRFRNVPHRLRLWRIEKLLGDAGIENRSWADVGCSNGFIIATMLKRYQPREVWGFDRSEAQVRKARESVPSARFAQLDLVAGEEPERRFAVVSCFETLEHVGDLRTALSTLIALTESGGTLVITVPIESGWRGAVKFAVKTVLYGYSMSELPDHEKLRGKYWRALISGERISAFRSEYRRGWATHFGFDWRDVDDLLTQMGVCSTHRGDLFTRYYKIYC